MIVIIIIFIIIYVIAKMVGSITCFSGLLVNYNNILPNKTINDKIVKTFLKH